jgi:hypothetical protein
MTLPRTAFFLVGKGEVAKVVELINRAGKHVTEADTHEEL